MSDWTSGANLPREAGSVDAVCAAAGLLVPIDVMVEIDDRDDLEGSGFCGYASPNGTTITLYPDAFHDVEQLVRTLVHELCHVRQLREWGPPRNSLELLSREREAYGEEERWWQSFRDKR